MVVKIAIVGCTNVGKTTLFNLLTGKKSSTGNWDGVTVDVTHAKLLFQNDIEVYDLPGINNILELPTASAEKSLDQVITKDFLLHQDADLILNVINLRHLHRDLYLTVELLETGVPVMIVILDDKNVQTDVLAKALKCKVLRVDLKQNGIIRSLSNEVRGYYYGLDHDGEKFEMQYMDNIMHELESIKHCNNGTSCSALQYMLNSSNRSNDIYASIVGSRDKFLEKLIDEAATISATCNVADQSYHHAGYSDLFDKILMHRFLSIPIFISVMCSIFFITTTIGDSLKDGFEAAVEMLLINSVASAMRYCHIPEIIVDVYQYGFGSGMKTLASFIPLIFILYTFLGLMEESGYMTRISIIMERIMSKVGLPGKAIIPLIMGFGCNVPAIIGTRFIDKKQQRLLTIMMMPFMSCSARLTVYTLFAVQFFPEMPSLIICYLYFFSVFLAAAFAFVLHGVLNIKTSNDFLIVALPQYKIPEIKKIFVHTLHKIKHFLLDTGRLIVMLSVLLYMLSSIPVDILTIKLDSNTAYDRIEKNSLLVKFSKTLIPVLHPMGIDEKNWPAVVGLVAGVLAKEIVVSTLTTLYEIDSGDGRDDTMHEYFTSHSSVFAYLLFIMLYFPCVSVFAIMKRETSIYVALFSSVFNTISAYLIAICFFKMSGIMHDLIAMPLLLITLGIIILSVVIRYVILLIKQHYIYK